MLDHAHRALRQNIKSAPALAVTQNIFRFRYLAPLADAQHLPKLHIAEALEKRQAAQDIEFFGVKYFSRGRRDMAEKSDQIARKLLPGLVAFCHILFHRTPHNS